MGTQAFDPSQLKTFDPSQLSTSPPPTGEVSFDPSQLKAFDPSQLSAAPPKNADGPQIVTPEEYDRQHPVTPGPLVMRTGIPAKSVIPSQKEPTFSEARQLAAKQVSDAVDENLPFLVGPFRLHAGIIKAGAESLTDPVSAAVIAGTAGLGAIPGGAARTLETGLSAYFATKAGESFVEKAPQVKAAVKQGDWQKVAELGGGALADAVIAYSAANHVKSSWNRYFDSIEAHNVSARQQLESEQSAGKASSEAGYLAQKITGEEGIPVEFGGKPYTVRAGQPNLPAEAATSARKPVYEVVDATGRVVRSGSGDQVSDYLGKKNASPAGVGSVAPSDLDAKYSEVVTERAEAQSAADQAKAAGKRDLYAESVVKDADARLSDIQKQRAQAGAPGTQLPQAQRETNQPAAETNAANFETRTVKPEEIAPGVQVQDKAGRVFTVQDVHPSGRVTFAGADGERRTQQLPQFAGRMTAIAPPTPQSSATTPTPAATEQAFAPEQLTSAPPAPAAEVQQPEAQNQQVEAAPAPPAPVLPAGSIPSVPATAQGEGNTLHVQKLEQAAGAETPAPVVPTAAVQQIPPSPGAVRAGDVLEPHEIADIANALGIANPDIVAAHSIDDLHQMLAELHADIAEHKGEPAPAKADVVPIRPQFHWQQTQAESGLLPEEHRAEVLDAARRGENVPTDVLSEYPDIAEEQPTTQNSPSNAGAKRVVAPPTPEEQTPSAKPPDNISAESKAEEPHEFSSTQVNLPAKLHRAFSDAADGVLTSDLSAEGRETDPHITALYGLHAEEPAAVKTLVNKYGPITATIGKVSVFKGDKQDVVKLDVDSPDLHRLNAELRKLPHTNSHPVYQPHITLAYVKSGEGEKYIGKEAPGLTGKTVTFNALTFTGKDRSRTEIPFTETVPARSIAEAVPDVMKEALPPSIANAPVDEPAAIKLANAVLHILQSGQPIGNNAAFQKLADAAYSGSRAQGKYELKEAYDALEVAVNRYIADSIGPDLLSADPIYAIGKLKDLLARLPTQNVRSDTQELLQQFSTPPTLSFIAAKVAAILASDTVLEPSAGTGSLAAWAKAGNAIVRVNEIDPKRATLLEYAVRGSRPTGADAEFLNSTLDQTIKPSVVIMNPPFSATGGRVTAHKNLYGFRHVTEALKRLQPRGRLVAILGEGATLQAKSATDFWAAVRKLGTVRANVGVSGKEYAKYGTTFGNRLLIIDKIPTAVFTAPGAGGKVVIKETSAPLIVPQGDYNTVEEAWNAIAEIASSRPSGLVPAASEAAEPAEPTGAVERPSGARGEATAGEPAVSGERSQQPESAGTGQVASRPAERRPSTGDANAQGQEPGHAPERGQSPEAGGVRADHGRNDRVIQNDDEASAAEPLRPDDRIALESRKQEDMLERTEDDSAFVEYVPSITGLAHPGRLVETKVMASVTPPPVTYRPNLPLDTIRKSPKPLSAPQMETVARAGQMHEQFAEDGSRLGLLLGDGTGVGKGQQIAAIIWDRNRSGQKRALWLSASKGLQKDARRDFLGIGADELADRLFSVNDWKAADTIDLKEGVLFSTYQSFISKAAGEKGQKRIDQIKDWLGDDGVIIFDESQASKNAVAAGEGRKATTSRTGEYSLQIQTNLPQAYIVYASATAATDVNNLGYMARLGLWGPGTPFHQGFTHFMGEIGRGGVAAMELIAREAKALGRYLSRSISYKGVAYEEKIHELTSDQRATYNVAARAWQKVLEMSMEQLEDNNADDSSAFGGFLNRYWGEHQRFFRKLLTAMKVPTVMELADKALEDGKSVVISLIGTGQAQADKALAAIQDADEDLDFSPKDSLIDLVRRYYPTQMYEEYEDEQGNVKKRPMMRDGEAVVNPDAVASRDALIDELNRELRLPENPLDQVIRYYGRDKVAELTGRRKTVERNIDTGKWQQVSRAPEGVPTDSINEYEMEQFQNGPKRIAIISRASGAGFSLHADLAAKNQTPRVHVVMELSWSADQQMQSFGRTHRSNQKQPPEYFIVSTDAGGEKRFSSTIARRLESLGALTKGQRDASGGGSVLAKYNFETLQGEQAANAFYTHLLRENPEIMPGFDGHTALSQMGVLKQQTDAEGNPIGLPNVANENMTNVTRLMNRILNIEVEKQNATFDIFTGAFDHAVQRAIEDGTLDTGVNVVRGDSIRLVSARTIATDPKTGAQTMRYTVEAERKNKPVQVAVIRDLAAKGRGKMMKRREYRGPEEPDQLIWAIPTNGAITTKSGSVRKAFNILRPGHRDHPSIYEKMSEDDLVQNWDVIEGSDTLEEIERLDASIASNEKTLVSYEANPESRYGQYYKENIATQKARRSILLQSARDAKKGQFSLWERAAQAAPAARVERIDMIGGSVMRVWPYLNVGAAKMDIRIAYPEGGGSVTGVVMSEGDANRVEQSLTGNEVARTAQSIYDAALRGKESFTLVGGPRLAMGRIGGKPVVEIITHDHNAQRFLRDQGVKFEKVGFQGRYYIPNDESGGTVLGKILKQYPVKEQGRAGGTRLPSEAGSAPAINDLIGWLDKTFGKKAPTVDYQAFGDDEPELRSHYDYRAAIKSAFGTGTGLSEVRLAAPSAWRALVKMASVDAVTRVTIRRAELAINQTLEHGPFDLPDLIRYYSQSRLEGIRDRWNDFAQQANDMSDENLAESMTSAFGNLLSAIENKRGIPQNLAQTAEALAQRQDWDTLRDLLVQSFSDAADLVAEVMGPDNFDRIRDLIATNDAAAEADRLYGASIESLMADYHSEHEGVMATALGAAGRYVPLTGIIPETKKGPRRGAFLGIRRPFKKPRNERNLLATGISRLGYDTTLEALENGLTRAVRASSKHQAIAAMEDAGLLKRYSKVAPEVFRFQGEYYPATRIEISPSRTMLVQEEGRTRTVQLPAQMAITAPWIYNEVKPILEAEHLDDNLIQKAMDPANAAAIFGPTLAIIDSHNILSTLTANTPFLGATLAEKAASFPLVKRFSAALMLARQIEPLNIDALDDLLHMAKIGVLPAKYGAKTWSSKIAAQSGAQKAKWWDSTPFLYGPSGIDVRARLKMYRIAKALNPDISDEELHDFINQIGTYVPGLQSKIERSLKKTGLAPFFTRGAQMLINGIHSWTGTGPMPKKGWQMRLATLLTGGAIMLVATWLTISKLMGWKPVGLLKSEINIPSDVRESALGRQMGWDKNGTTILDFTMWNPTAGRGARALGLLGAVDTLMEGGTWWQAIEYGSSQALSTVGQPAVGPLPRAVFVGVMGVQPYLTAGRDRSGHIGPQFFPAVPPKHAGLQSFAERLGAAALSANAMESQIGQAAGFLSPDPKDEGGRYLKMISDLALPGANPKVVNLYSKQQMLYQQRTGTR